MSVILDALKKASEERGHVRSPIARGELYLQTRLQPATGAPAANHVHGVTTAALAVGALVLTATVFIGIVVWASRLAAPQPAQLVAAAPTGNSPTLPAPGATPPSGGGTDQALAPPEAPGQPPGRRLVDQYLQSQLLPTVPITVEPEPPVAETLPPPEPVEMASVAPPTDALIGRLPPPPLPPASDSPLLDSLGVGDALPLVEEDTEPIEPEPRGPRWRLEGIVWDERQPMAIVNGAIVGVGDKVEDATVTSIRNDGVILLVDGREVEVTY